jgi:GT2 family glycosyltransferase
VTTDLAATETEEAARRDIAAVRRRAAAPPAITVAISTRNRGSLIAETLATLLRLPGRNFEILVVDQSTDSRTRDVVGELAGQDPRVRYQASNTIGSSAGRNLALYNSSAEVIAYSDDDVIAGDGWLDAITEEFADPATAAVYGRLLPYEYEGRTGKDVGLKDTAERAVFRDRVPPWYIGHGGNMAFRRSALLAVGGFDPLLGAGCLLRSCEDIDLTYRLLRAGKTIVYSPRAQAYHKQWKDWPAQKQMEHAYGVGAGALFSKYLRCGDWYGLRLFVTWIWQLGVRRLGAGLLKWKSLNVMYLGYCQLVYPWLGVLRSQRYGVDRRSTLYVSPFKEYVAEKPIGPL